MIQVELIDEETGDCIACPKWPAVPGIGENFSTATHDYVVTGRAWGVCCDGSGDPIWGSQCATITLKKVER